MLFFKTILVISRYNTCLGYCLKSTLNTATTSQVKKNNTRILVTPVEVPQQGENDLAMTLKVIKTILIVLI